MLVGAVVLFAFWLFNPSSTIVLVMAIVATLWGILWIVLQQRSNTNTQREMVAADYQIPKDTKWVALSRVSQGFTQGWLITDHQRLYFYKGRLETKPGKHLDLATDTLMPIIELDKLERFRHVASFWGGGRLELYNQAGKSFKFHLKDPEGLPLLLQIIE